MLRVINLIIVNSLKGFVNNIDINDCRFENKRMENCAFFHVE